MLALVFVHSAPNLKASDADFAAFYAGNSTVLVTVGLYLVPFAGIAFLWHMNTVRLLIRTRTPEPSAIPDGLQLMAGILFVALLFAGTARPAAVALLKDLTGAPLPSMDVARGLLAVGYSMVFVYSVRGAGMYALTTTTLLANAGIMPRWLAVVGYLLAAFLLVSTTMNPVVMLLLPAWAVLVGLVILIRTRQLAEPTAPKGKPHDYTATAPTATQHDVDEIPGPKGVPVLGNMFDVPADRTIQTAMELVREFGPMVRLRTPVGDRFIASGLDMIDDLCDDERFDKLVGDGQKAVRSFGPSAGLFTSDTDDPNWSKAHNILLPNFSTAGDAGLPADDERHRRPADAEVGAAEPGRPGRRDRRHDPADPGHDRAVRLRLPLQLLLPRHPAPVRRRHDGRAAGEPDPEP